MKERSLKYFITGILSVGLIVNLVACNNAGKAENRLTVKVSGSTSIGPIMEKLSEEYSKENDINIEINQVGSSAGIKDAIDGLSDLGMASRELKTEEEESLDKTVIAYDGIAVVISTNNDVTNLTMEDIKNIYTGKITKWSEVGGSNGEDIVVLSREDGSGTRDAFQEIVGYNSEKLSENTMILNSNGALKQAVYGNENSIAFISFEYLDEKVKSVYVNGIEANVDNVKSETYELYRPFILVTKKESSNENSKNIIDFILSDDGQTLINDNGLISIK